MKCEKCGVNEASVFLRETADGHTAERCLCAACARELGLEVPESPAVESEEGVFAMPVAWVIAAPALRRKEAETKAPEEPRNAAPGPRLRRPTPVDPALNRRRERNALRARMAEAVRTEDYAEAARLRDALRSLESGTD